MVSKQQNIFVRCSARYELRNQRKLHNVYKTALAVHNTDRTTPALGTHLPTLRRMCHSYIAGLPTQNLIKLQLLVRLYIRTRRVRMLILPGFRCQVCSSLVKL